MKNTLQTKLKTTKNASLYLHVPFCASKCPYCAFTSGVPTQTQMQNWLDGVKKEIKLIKTQLPQNFQPSTIYIGGGTPSILPTHLLQDLLTNLHLLNKNGAPEYTIEANPDSFSQKFLQTLKPHGINRISLGIQSLIDDELKTLARKHTSTQALKALDQIIAQNFRASADLMFGLPNQTLKSFHQSLKTLVKTGLKHISLYQLTLEENSFWGKKPPQLTDGYPMYRWAQYYLKQKNFTQYEIASFAQESDYSRHNLSYWQRTNVIALGPSSWGYLNGARYHNHSDLDSYLKTLSSNALPIAHTENLLTPSQNASEHAILALRTKWGIDKKHFIAQHSPQKWQTLLNRLQNVPTNCYNLTDSALTLTPKGMRVGNSIWELLLDL